MTGVVLKIIRKPMAISSRETISKVRSMPLFLTIFYFLAAQRLHFLL